MSDSDEDSIGELVIDEGSETSELSKFKSNHTIFFTKFRTIADADALKSGKPEICEKRTATKNN